MRKFAICILMLALFAGYAIAQTVNATLGGTITDASEWSGAHGELKCLHSTVAMTAARSAL